MGTRFSKWQCTPLHSSFYRPGRPCILHGLVSTEAPTCCCVCVCWSESRYPPAQKHKRGRLSGFMSFFTKLIVCSFLAGLMWKVTSFGGEERIKGNRIVHLHSFSFLLSSFFLYPFVIVQQPHLTTYSSVQIDTSTLEQVYRLL